MKTKTYRVLVESGEDGWLVAEVPELRGCFTQGKTRKQIEERIREAIAGYLEAFEKQKNPQFEIEIKEELNAVG